MRPLSVESLTAHMKITIDLSNIAEMTSKPNPKDFIRSAAAARRPVLTHLNNDISWLLQVPMPTGPRPYFNVVIEPWLANEQIEYNSWFHKQSHVVESVFQSMAEVEAYANEVSDVAAGFLDGFHVSDENRAYGIDAVALSLELTDHTHKETLLELPPSVPIVASAAALDLVQAWDYFEIFSTMPLFTSDWRESKHACLPDNIGIAWLQQKPDLLSVHQGLAVFMNLGNDRPEALVSAAHGIRAESEQMKQLADAIPPLQFLASLHGMMRVPIGLSYLPKADANLGAHNGLAVRRLLDAKYWIPTGDAKKHESGLTSYLVSSEQLTVEDALVQEKQQRRESGIAGEEDWPASNYYLVANGQSKVLL